MGDIYDISVSGLRVFQGLLSTVSHNIANVNTEGYSRQTVSLATRPPEYTGFGYLGSGVTITSVRRQFDDFINSQVVSNTSILNQLDKYYGLASQLDNLVADPQAGLAKGIQNFFDATQNVADDPTSVPARQLLLGEGQALIERFQYFDRRLTALRNDANSTIESSVAEINSIAANIAKLNLQIVTASGNPNTQPVNDLLDQREKLVVDLSKHVAVSTLKQDDGTLNVFIGNGQALVVGVQPQTLSVANNAYDVSRKDIFSTNGSASVNVTEQISGGALGAAVSFIRDTWVDTRNALGRVALGLAGTLNNQHRLGQDLNGALGSDFFRPINSANFGASVLDSTSNSSLGFGVVSAQISDVGALTNSDYVLKYGGSNQFVLTRLTDNATFSINAGSGYPYTATTIDGVQITINSAPTSGDSFRIQPTANAVSGIGLALTDPRAIAAAVPVRGGSSLLNSGTGLIGSTTVTNATTYVPSNYQVIFSDNSGAVADGTTRGILTDASANSTLQYELRINNVLVYTQTEAGAPLANVTALATQINTQTSATGVRAYVNAAGTSLFLANDPPNSASITVAETLNTTAGVVENGDTVTGYFGSALTGLTNPTNSLTFGGAADSYLVLNSSSAVVASGAYTAGANINFNGIQTSISGTPNVGDIFTVRPNTSGVGDNRNMLNIAALQEQRLLAGGTATYLDAYGYMVADVGTQTRKVEITRDAQQVLLKQSVATREAKSGVNLDEEAANLVRFQQAYQAVAQVIATANSLFQTLIGVVGRG